MGIKQKAYPMCRVCQELDKSFLGDTEERKPLRMKNNAMVRRWEGYKCMLIRNYYMEAKRCAGMIGTMHPMQ